MLHLFARFVRAVGITLPLAAFLPFILVSCAPANPGEWLVGVWVLAPELHPTNPDAAPVPIATRSVLTFNSDGTLTVVMSGGPAKARTWRCLADSADELHIMCDATGPELHCDKRVYFVSPDVIRFRDADKPGEFVYWRRVKEPERKS